jgi:hypothetical protein
MGYGQSKKPPKGRRKANLYRLSSHSSQMKRGKGKADGTFTRRTNAELAPASAPKLGKTEKSDSERRAESCHGVSRYCTLRTRNI